MQMRAFDKGKIYVHLKQTNLWGEIQAMVKVW